MYTNIPTNELITIIELTCQNNYVDVNTTRDFTKLAKALITQNYFRFKNMTYVQPDGLAVGAPSSSILSEFYLQHLESHKIYSPLLSHKVEGYFRYDDDILIIYNEDNTNIDTLLNHFNNLSPKLKFTIEKEKERQISFLDITITRGTNKFSIEIYRKPTYTDAIIPVDFCHPMEQKMAAIRYLYNRLNQYQQSLINLEKENNVILQIMNNSGYETSVTKKLYKKRRNSDAKDQKKLLAKFTYVGRETRAITKAFEDTCINP